MPHHYAHLVITDKNKNIYAVELGTQKTSVYAIDELIKEYATENIPVRWLVVGDFSPIFNEKGLIFIKRFLVNNTEKRDFIMLDWHGEKVYQCRWDSKKYESNGREIKIVGYTELYYEQLNIDSLIFENGEFSLIGFDERYENWLKDKERRFLDRVQEIEESRTANEYIHAARRDYEMSLWNSNEVSSYAIRRAEILTFMDQREHPVVDSAGIKWYCCDICGKIDEEGEFVILNRNNTGSCRDCMIRKH